MDEADEELFWENRMRIPRPILFMEHALLESRRSTCFRLNVGCVIVDPESRTIISTGYNGPASGKEHCTGGACAGERGCLRSIHAEINALKKVSSLFVGKDKLDMYVTHSPCGECLTYAWTTGLIKRLFFQNEYRLTEHLKEYKDRMDLYKLTPAGYITRFGDSHLFDPEGFYA